MSIIRDSSSQEVVLVWLQAELESERFGEDLKKTLDKYNLSSKFITSPNLLDDNDNILRLQVLKDYRDWFKDDVYDYTWQLAELTKDDVSTLSYIDYSYWNELSDNTHFVGAAAKNIKLIKTVFDVSNKHFFDIAKAVEAGEQFSPIILIERSDRLEIVEGHARATGYMLANKPNNPIQALIGAQN